MNDWQMVLITSGISALVAMLTGWISSKLAYNSEVKKYLYSKRELLYHELYENLDKFLMDLSLVYDKDYQDNLYTFKPKVKLVGSRDVINGFKGILTLINQYSLELEKFRMENDPQCCEKLYETRVDENGEEHKIFHGSMSDINRYERLEKDFSNNNFPESIQVSELINEIVNAMRRDLGNRNMRW